MNEITLFGNPELKIDHQHIKLPEKAFYIIYYLMSTAQNFENYLNRSTLAEFLWSDVEEKVAKSNLRQLLRRIRTQQSVYKFEIIIDDGEKVGLNLCRSEVDILKFETLIHDSNPDAVIELCDLYVDDILSTSTPYEPNLEQWIFESRAYWRNKFVESIEYHLKQQSFIKSQASAKRLTSQLLKADPYNEVAIRAYLQIEANAGKWSELSSAYQQFCTLLKKDLNAEVEIETAELYRTLIAGSNAPLQASTDGSNTQTVVGKSLPTPSRCEIEAFNNTCTLLPRHNPGIPRLAILVANDKSTEGYFCGMTTNFVEEMTCHLVNLKQFSVKDCNFEYPKNNNFNRKFLNFVSLDYVLNIIPMKNFSIKEYFMKIYSAYSREIIWADKIMLTPNVSVDVLVCDVVKTILRRIECEERARFDISTERTAYDWYLHGKQSLNNINLPSLRRAQRSFKASLALAETFVPSITGYARAIQLEWLLRAQKDTDLLQGVQDYARRAIQVNPEDSRGYRELAIYHLYISEFDECLNMYSRAESLSPNCSELLMDYADALVHCGLPSDSLTKVKEVIQLNPNLSDLSYWTAAGAEFQLGHYREAARFLEKMQDITPASRLASAVYAMAGQGEKAFRYANQVFETYPDFTISSWLKGLPMSDSKQLLHYEQGLRKAGFN